jgi:hypothetical protein
MRRRRLSTANVRTHDSVGQRNPSTLSTAMKAGNDEAAILI